MEQIPPFFCAATETARDVAQDYFESSEDLPEHPLEHTMLQVDLRKYGTPSDDSLRKFLNLIESYVDDFIRMIQSTNRETLTRFTRAILRGVEDIFPTPDISGSIMPPPISIKKLEEEGVWETQKIILGWLLNSIAKTIQHTKCEQLLSLLSKTRRKATVSYNKLKKIRGKLQFLTVALPVGQPLLGHLDSLLAI